jgi:hypothetical protein
MRRRVLAEKLKKYMAEHADMHPPLTTFEKLCVFLGGDNPYHRLLPDVPWERLRHEQAVAMGLEPVRAGD